ncbi:heterogeneous nuclear ribonucleoprotein L-like isoform X2 [Chironomus tepperi]|uniref:heterogeneous nuclear ribonucleoprotein L-like isoform X2 n=1 Tax=Chironomus tepperi TaxID=113505 RepID=UPI00391F6071
MKMAFNGCDTDGPHNKRLCMGQNVNDNNNNTNGTGLCNNGSSVSDVEMKTGHGLIRTQPNTISQNPNINTSQTNTSTQQNQNNINSIITNSSDEPRRKRQDAARPNHILLFTIINPVYPITVEVIYTICHPHGNVLRIVIFKKNGVQAMVEFDSIDSATRARDNLNGCDIYSSCCTLKIDYAKPEKLNVYKNDSDISWDYTLGKFSKEMVNGRTPLLQDPLFGARPTPYKPPLLGNAAPGYTYVPTQDYSQTNGTVVPSIPTPGTPLTPTITSPTLTSVVSAGAEPWKQSPTPPQSLMKEPPLTANRNTTTQFATQGQQQAAVMMVYGLDAMTSNTDKLFNLVCLYGNVARIKFLKTKEGTAMVQMGEPVAVERCVQHLNNIPVGNNGKLQIAFSKQSFLSEVTNPYSLPDNSPSFKEYTGSKNNRFLSLAQACKNRIQPPSKILHFFNTPPSLSEDQLVDIFAKKDVPPSAVRMFPLKTERSSSGLIEFPSIAQAVLAIMKCNHTAIERTKFPFIMKLCFSSSKNLNVNYNNENEKMNGDKPDSV